MPKKPKPKSPWTFHGACYHLTVGENSAQIYPLKHSMMPPLYHCYVSTGPTEPEFFIEKTLRKAKAKCEEKLMVGPNE